MESDVNTRQVLVITPQSFETVKIGGVKTACISRADLTNLMLSDCIAARSQQCRAKLVFDLNGHALSTAARDRRYRAYLEAADLVHADGQVIVAASRYLTSTPVPERTATTDFFHDAAKAASTAGLSFFLLGGTEEVNSDCARTVKRLYPDLKILGRSHGYFSAAEEAGICEQINASGADVVWVGLGKPREQEFCVRNRDRIKAGWMITCGGCFNYITGRYSRAPQWMQDMGFEWLHRFVMNCGSYFGAI